ncbi:hypothetical protein ALNOE001_06570 [Candidatus Methanobinarius endosymbioticus]|uniref:Uncharacterized protein n=1 Tax=Candidatus Methanobinarius endosymbioticus TaxID=2006182 RepID=A0A366MCE4_9EURY|nr:hypothetical protein ALNOE001_06570 [Candidatus Methanobinarius endosymbioticus]
MKEKHNKHKNQILKLDEIANISSGIVINRLNSSKPRSFHNKINKFNKDKKQC